MWLRWLGWFGLWTAIALWFGAQFYFRAPFHVSFWDAFSSSLLDWYSYAALSIFVVALARRYQFQRLFWGRLVVTHLAASLLFAELYVLLLAFEAQLHGAAGFTQLVKPIFLKTVPFSIGIYWVILSVVHAIDYYRELHDRELRNVELERRLAQAKLQALQMQMNPHFLFNTLHTISALVHSDVNAADKMIARLSELLRLALDNTDDHEVTLRQELEFLRRYLEIEQTRFRERLTVKMEIAPDTLDARVPNLVLQPLVENAIRHGIEPHAKPGLITLRSFSENGTLHLEVLDNGAGLPRGHKREGIGTSNTRSRLQQLYGEQQTFELANAENGGTMARVTLPLRRESPAK